MIIYDLNCDAGHHFEGWFGRPADYVEQKRKGILSCPICSSTNVKKIPTASHVKTQLTVSASEDEATKPSGQQVVSTHAMQALHRYIDKHFADVGAQFPEEARKIHYGEAEERSICGVASNEEVKELHEEGIEVHRLPPKPVEKEKLN